MAKELPVWGAIPSLLEAVSRGRNVVLTAPPGSGKTTQVPQALLDSGSVRGSIVVVQPRRVACRAVSKWVASERKIGIGGEVGYIVRYDGKTSSDTKILYVTDGVLLRFLERDPGLSWAGAVVFDEFHERRATTDVALSLLRTEQMRRPSLRLLVMSATIESTQVSRYLDAVNLDAAGTSFPVEVRYQPIGSHDEALDAVAPAVASLHSSDKPGDILVFLAGKEEIKRVAESIAAFKLKDAIVLPLHGELMRKAQDRVFRPTNGRKVILATNVAETSVTIPNVRCVIDTGYEKRADYDPALGINRLSLMRISRSSADQRKGRAGREAPGLCIRLWDRKIQDEMAEHAPVEMLRTDLSEVVMTLKSVGIVDPLTFPFLEQPETERLEAAEQGLTDLGALGEDRRLSPLGWRMLRLPLPPRYARMVVESEHSGCLKEVASIAALMSGRPILYDQRELGEREHGRLHFAQDDSSDFFSLLEMFRVSRIHRWTEGWCEQNGVNFDALEEAIRLRRKIIHAAFTRGSPQTNRPGEPEAIRRCILAGLVDRVAQQESQYNYRLTNGLECSLDGNTVVTGKLLAAADVRLKRLKKNDANQTATLGYVTRVDADMCRRVMPRLLKTVIIPVSFDRSLGILTVRETTRSGELLLDSLERRVDIVEAVHILAEQKRRAKLNGWHRVDVSPGLRRKSYVVWQGQKMPVEAQDAGPHWASVYGSQSPKIILREKIVVLPGIEDETPEPLPADIRQKVERTSSALSKLLKACS